jgi:6-pyruvoyltetrahydropterin/6-carboxytetrahydropterin synthase
MIEVGVARTFHAMHRLPQEVGAASHEHEHDYRVEAIVRGDALDESGMLLNLDLLEDALAACLDELDGADLETVPALSGRPTTVEMVADHVWQGVQDRLGLSGGLRSLRVTLYESADAWASVDRGLDEGTGAGA